MKPLVIEQFPLYGASLIEASAGTGKTYTIVNLYLRLLLGHQCPALNTEQILVVTFTNAATAELKERIRQRVHQAYLDFFSGASDDRFTQQLINDSDDVSLDCQRLALAIRQMDDASVFTIHSFCQRMLSEHAFESGANYDEQFELDESQWILLAAQDYWRKHISILSKDTLAHISQLWSSPDALSQQLMPFLNRQWLSLHSVSIDQANQHLTRYLERLSSIKSWWLRCQIAQQLKQGKLKKNSKLGKFTIVDAMQVFCQSNVSLCPFGSAGFTDFSAEKLVKAKSKDSPQMAEVDFTVFDDLELLRVSAMEALSRAYLEHSVKHIKNNLDKHKARLNLLSPNDLLSRLQSALSGHNRERLTQVITQSYPFALIDEFQDTDPIQFDVFNQLYSMGTQGTGSGLVMIGDPKQAIYGFRGADIFTYIKAKRLVDPQRHFTLDKNWRSANGLVHAVNSVFANSEVGFLFDADIPFHPVKAARGNAVLEIDSQPQKALNMLHLHGQGECLAASTALPIMADGFANHIASILEDGELITEQDDKVAIRASDCCVLVRDRSDASMIKQALAAKNIASVFLVRQSVFATSTAHDIYRLLSALCHPHDERKLKAALCSPLLCLDALQLDTLFSDEVRWQEIVEHVYIWQKRWQEKGIMLALTQVMQFFDVYQNLLVTFGDGLRRLTDLRHITELLQQQSSITSGENQLLNWFANQLSDPDHGNEAQQLRLESDANLVQIITMHASKGLEFPLVFIPFASKGKKAKDAIYNDPEQGSIVDFSAQESSLQQADFERLAEDIRLFYVALTRAKYYCAVGIWNPSEVQRKSVSNLYNTACGRLLLEASQVPGDDVLKAQICRLGESAQIGYINIDTVPEVAPQKLQPDQHMANWQVSTLTQPVRRQWQLTSYSAIARDQQHPEWERPGLDEHEGMQAVNEVDEDPAPSRFNFTKGAQAGSFLHGVLEQVPFQRPDNLMAVIEQQGKWFGIEPDWFELVYEWILDVLVAPISVPEQGPVLSLSALQPHQVRVEMEFHLPLKQVNVADFNRIINRHYPTQSRQYGFTTLNGMLKGFIDLTFEHHGRYYVADYKSNYLGDGYDHYSEQNMQVAMQEHDYQLQLILYVLALHRFLRLLLPDYHYEQHIGGAFYLFLRGMSESNPCNGCYYDKPSQLLIDELDNLFNNANASNALHTMEQLPLC